MKGNNPNGIIGEERNPGNKAKRWQETHKKQAGKQVYNSWDRLEGHQGDNEGQGVEDGQEEGTQELIKPPLRLETLGEHPQVL